jgi:hypothetical protein
MEAASRQPTVVDRLRRMTVENGCTPAEAAAALAKARQLEGRAA